MSKQPMGKTLLRNVIRHTDAHNKIQEEMEMWKMRDWEVNTSQHKPFLDTASMRGSMHCDRVPDLSRNRSESKERVSEHDNRESQNWTRKLYEFEAKDPDRWGHSGFKELYPEEFESDNEKRGAIRKTGRHKMKKSKSDTEAYLSKRSKKSSRKKKKKKKKSGDGKRKKDEPSDSDCSSDDRSDARRKQRKKKSTKGRHKNKKVVKTTGGDEDSSSSGGSGDEKNRERRTNSRKKRKHNSVKDWDSELDSKKKKRKNWKAAGEESSDDSSID